MAIHVVDSIMGSGKSTWIREYMNTHPERRWWYIGVYLNEASVPVTGCPGLHFQEPSDESRTKSDDLVSLIKKGVNIASTHQLFLRIIQTPEFLEMLQAQEYTLVIDEVLDVIEDLSKSNDDIQGQLALNKISISSEDNQLTFLQKVDSRNSLADVVPRMKTANVYYNGVTLLSVFKPEIFKMFRDVYVLTYLFSGSRMRMYFDFYGFQYNTFYVSNGELSSEKRNNLPEKRKISGLINLYQGPLYEIEITGWERTRFSQSWYNDRRYNKYQEQLFKNTYNYLHNSLHATGKNTMYTVFKNVYKKNPSLLPGYKKAFVECTAKATNNFRDRNNLAYLVNMFQDPEIRRFLSPGGIEVNEEAFARCFMLQWIWRSAIRDGKPINLFLPSSRMRGILKEWMEHKD